MNALLSEAIASAEGVSSACAPGDYSTEDSLVLDELRKRRFEVLSHTLAEEAGVTHHLFLLHANGVKISANIVESQGKCVRYDFGRIVE